MSDKSIAVKVTLSSAEVKCVDMLIKKGIGKNRADVCRNILLLYRDKTEA